MYKVIIFMAIQNKTNLSQTYFEPDKLYLTN